MRFIPSKPYLVFKDIALPQLRSQAAKLGTLPIGYKCNVKLVYYRGDRRKTDLVNLQEGTLDLLVEAGILEDDNYNIVASMDGSKVEYDKENARTEIAITKLKKG
jgi:Holliday junction resolvase RusA-like endonuclease